MKFKLLCTILLAAVIPMTLLQAEDRVTTSIGSGDKIVLGSKEMVYLDPPGLVLEGRIDTGAALSSLHGADISLFTREGSRWVRFNVHYKGEDHYIEKPVQSIIRVVQANSPSGSERPVVRMTIRIGSLTVDADFTVADRSRMSFPVLIGRNVLAGRALVDVSRDFLQSPKE